MEEQQRLHNMVLSALSEPHLEVRELASNSLSSILRGAKDSDALELIVSTNIQSYFQQLLKNFKFESNFCSIFFFQKKQFQSKIKKPSSSEPKSNIESQHAGILGLSALVLSVPYTIPSWLPDILVILSHSLKLPFPINGTVKKTFQEFWRTHQDNWIEHKLKFTPEQLDEIPQSIVAPTYFT
jgi:proteasome activator subunit 4